MLRMAACRVLAVLLLPAAFLQARADASVSQVFGRSRCSLPRPGVSMWALSRHSHSHSCAWLCTVSRARVPKRVKNNGFSQHRSVFYKLLLCIECVFRPPCREMRDVLPCGCVSLPSFCGRRDQAQRSARLPKHHGSSGNVRGTECAAPGTLGGRAFARRLLQRYGAVTETPVTFGNAYEAYSKLCQEMVTWSQVSSLYFLNSSCLHLHQCACILTFHMGRQIAWSACQRKCNHVCQCGSTFTLIY